MNKVIIPQIHSIKAQLIGGTLFNTPSFRQLAEKAFGVKKFPHLIFDRDDATKSFADPYRENILFSSIQAFEKDYEQHCAAVRRAFMQSEVFIITLGLNECWQYIGDDSFISRNPTNKALSTMVRHRVLSLEENVSNIQTFIDIIRAHNPSFKLIISVSPVPLMATGRADDYHVITANGHSKAMMRLTAEQIVNTNENVFYFPSYELVTTCTKEPWTEDQRHVSRSAVDRVMNLFDQMFVQKAD